MSESFDFNEWIRNNKTGPYSKDSFSRKGMLKESEEPIEEDDTMEEAPVPPSPENVYEPDSEQDYYDRAMDLAGMQIKSAIDALMQDGFDKEEIEELLPRLAMTLVMDYDTAFSGMDEGEVSEGSTYWHNRPKYRRKWIDDEPEGDKDWRKQWAQIGKKPEKEKEAEKEKPKDSQTKTESEEEQGRDKYGNLKPLLSKNRPSEPGEDEYFRIRRLGNIDFYMDVANSEDHLINLINAHFRKKADKVSKQVGRQIQPYVLKGAAADYVKNEYTRKKK